MLEWMWIPSPVANLWRTLSAVRKSTPASLIWLNIPSNYLTYFLTAMWDICLTVRMLHSYHEVVVTNLHLRSSTSTVVNAHRVVNPDKGTQFPGSWSGHRYVSHCVIWVRRPEWTYVEGRHWSVSLDDVILVIHIVGLLSMKRWIHDYFILEELLHWWSDMCPKVGCYTLYHICGLFTFTWFGSVDPTGHM